LATESFPIRHIERWRRANYRQQNKKHKDMRGVDKQLWAGAARQEITPPVGSPLSGFIARLSVSTDVSDPLFTRALVLRHGQTIMVLVQMDLLGLARWHVDEIRRVCRGLGAVLPENVFISATHTHSGPGMLPVRGCLVASLDYQWSVVTKTIQAIKQAYALLQPARLFSNRVRFHLGVNRREKTANGIVLGVDPRKPAPKFVDVAELRMGDGGSCVLFSHAAHPYVLGGDQSLISGDFPSFACQFLERSSGTTAMFLNGCAGDIAPERAFQGVEAAQGEGSRLAEAVRQAMGGAREIAALPLRALSKHVYLPYAKLPTLTDLEAMRIQQERTVRPEERADTAVADKIRAALDDWANAVTRVVNRIDPLKPVFSEVQAFRIGGLCLLAISGEPFFQIGQRIVRSSPAKNIWALGYSNAYTGYLPTASAFPEGGYEVSDSFRYLGIWALDPSCEVRVVTAARKLLIDIYGK
jgi:neutral ceramidase